MTYKCSTCEHTAEEAGSCPTCNTPLQEVAAEASTEAPAAETPTASPEATDSSSDAPTTA